MLRSAPGAVEVFTVGRLILSLDKEHPKRTELATRFREAVARLIPGEATTRCRVILAQLDDNPDEAVALLRSSISVGTLPAGEGMKPDIYFQRCNLGQVLIAMKRTEDAIDALMPAAGFTFGGEAKFHLAVAYALQGEGRDSSRWLSQAVQESPKWAAHARDHVALRDVPEVIDELAKLGRA